MKVAKRQINLKTIMLVFLAIFGLLFFFVPQNLNFTNAEVFTGRTYADDNFSITMTARGRQASSLNLNEQTITNKLGKVITYLCFDWRNINSLNFQFNATLPEDKEFLSFEFLLTYKQSDDLTTPIISFDEDKTPQPTILYQDKINGNSFPQRLNFTYYIDKDSPQIPSDTNCNGNDFGLYRFDFKYTYKDKESETTFTRSICDKSGKEIYIAILPDSIDNFTENTNVRILYSVTSSNGLLNRYSLTLSSDVFKYVNPAYLRWQVTGTDTMKTNYCLNQQMIDEDISLSNYKVLWEALETPIGTSFVFDSHGVEGTWEVTLSVRNPDGSEKFTRQVSNLSTIKVEPVSYWWLWLLIALLVVLVAVVITIIVVVVKKKHEKVW